MNCYEREERRSNMDDSKCPRRSLTRGMRPIVFNVQYGYYFLMLSKTMTTGSWQQRVTEYLANLHLTPACRTYVQGL